MKWLAEREVECVEMLLLGYSQGYNALIFQLCKPRFCT